VNKRARGEGGIKWGEGGVEKSRKRTEAKPRLEKIGTNMKGYIKGGQGRGKWERESPVIRGQRKKGPF